MSSSKLENAPSQVIHAVSEGMGRMIVIRNGYDVWHFGGDPYGRKTWWASVGRALMTAMFGQLIMEGGIGGDTDAVERPVNQINCDEAKTFGSDVMLKHLLSYTSCANPPGSSYEYGCNYFGMYRIVEQLSITSPVERITNLGKLIGGDWDETIYWGHNDPGGSPFLSISATEADAARWGYLWMNNGTWNGKTIVPAWYVKRSLEPMPSPYGGYADENQGWQIHTNWGGGFGSIIPRDAFWKTGGGQRVIFACPSLNLVFAQSLDEANYDVQVTAEAVINCIVSGGDPGSVSITSLAAGDVLEMGSTVILAGTGSNMQWSYDANSDGLSRIEIGSGDSVAFTVPTGVVDPKEITITLEAAEGTTTLKLGLSDPGTVVMREIPRSLNSYRTLPEAVYTLDGRTVDLAGLKGGQVSPNEIVILKYRGGTVIKAMGFDAMRLLR